ncbi:MAG TPA: hypothetical protein DD435_02300 [Cyanobacteria bacterium UBA8530]|nr:hypothetical protein [Cyanobacteria bacterium UBA8530]
MNQRNLASIAFLAVPLAIALFSGCTVNANKAGVDFAQNFPIYSGVPATKQKTPTPSTTPTPTSTPTPTTTPTPTPTTTPTPTPITTPTPTATPLFVYQGSGPSEPINNGPFTVSAGAHEFRATSSGSQGLIAQLYALRPNLDGSSIDRETELFDELGTGPWTKTVDLMEIGVPYYIRVDTSNGPWTISVY